MATPFTEEERNFINMNLKEVAKECLERYGVRKTTVDQMVEMTGISKGSFYNFYPGKEILFFKVLEEFQESIINELLEKFADEQHIGVNDFTAAIYSLYQFVRESFLMTIIKNGELEYLMRRLPQDVISNHHSLDSLLANKVFSHVQLKDGVNSDAVLTALRAIFMSMVYINEVGEKHYDEALTMLIHGLSLQIIKGI